MKEIWRARDLAEAQLVKDMLEGQGIPAVVVGQSLATITGEVPFTETWPKVCVPDEREDEALGCVQKEMAAVQAAAVRKLEPWKCPQCGESVEGQFSECWNCQSGRPGK